jgi:hypothetical protein
MTDIALGVFAGLGFPDAASLNNFVPLCSRPYRLNRSLHADAWKPTQIPPGRPPREAGPGDAR